MTQNQTKIRQILAIFVFCFAFCSAASAQIAKPKLTPKPAPTPTPAKNETIEEDADVLRIDTELVNVPAVVTDRNGKPLAKLKQGNFVVLENGVPQEIESFATTEAPFEIALLLDTSGSTRSELSLIQDRKSTRLNSSHANISYAVFCLKKKEP